MARTGTGRIYQQGRIWWIDYSFRGKRHRESSGSDLRKDAKALLRKRMAEMGKGKLAGRTEEKVTFEDLARMIEDDYRVNRKRSIKRLRTSLLHLGEFFAENRALDITTDRVRRHMAARLEDGAANSSIQKELAALKRAFNLAVQAGQLSSRPHIPSIRVNNTREGFFDPGDLERVIAELPEPLRPVVRFAALTGWRSGEVLPLQWSRVDFEAGVIRLAPGTTKSGDGTELPFRALPKLDALLSDQREKTRAIERECGEIIPHVFHRDGKRIVSMRKAWLGACKRAGLEGSHFHDLRRTAVRNLERAGVPRSVATKVTGHKTESVYLRYAIADRSAMEEGLGKLAKLHAEVTGQPPTVVPIQDALG